MVGTIGLLATSCAPKPLVICERAIDTPGGMRSVRVIGDVLVSKLPINSLGISKNIGEEMLMMASKGLQGKGYRVVSQEVSCIGCLVSASTETYMSDGVPQTQKSEILADALRDAPFYISSEYARSPMLGILLHAFRMTNAPGYCAPHTSTAGNAQLKSLTSKEGEDATLLVSMGWQESDLINAMFGPVALVLSSAFPERSPNAGAASWEPYLQVQLLNAHTGEVVWAAQSPASAEEWGNVKKMETILDRTLRALPEVGSLKGGNAEGLSQVIHPIVSQKSNAASLLKFSTVVVFARGEDHQDSDKLRSRVVAGLREHGIEAFPSDQFFQASLQYSPATLLSELKARKIDCFVDLKSMASSKGRVSPTVRLYYPAQARPVSTDQVALLEDAIRALISDLDKQK